MSVMPKNANKYRFDILGHKLKSNDLPDVLAQWLENRWNFPQHNVTPEGKSITLNYAESCPRFPDNAEVELLNLHEMQLECRQANTIYYLGNKKEGSSLNPETYELSVWGVTQISFMALQVALAEILRLSGYLPLHASVIAKDGKATAFSAPSGTGKTTTLLTAFKAGFKVIAEDFIWINPDSMQVFTWDKGVRLLPDTFERFKQLLPKDFKGTKDSMNKVFVPYEVLGVNPQSEVFLEKLVWLSRDLSQATAWGTVTKRDAAMKLWEAAGIPFTEQAKSQLSNMLPKVIKQASLESLQIGKTALFTTYSTH